MYDIEQPYGPLVATTMRLISWNVWGRYGPWAEREQAIGDTLAACDPDIVALPEAWATSDDAQVVRLSKRLGLPEHAFAPGLDENGHPVPDGEQSGDGVISGGVESGGVESGGVESGGVVSGGVVSGTGLLSRWPILRHERQTLGDGGGWDSGSVLFAEIDGPRGPIHVFTAMLAWRLDHSELRQGQVRDLGAYIDRIADRRAPVALCGDFNTGPDTDEIRMITGRSAVAAPGLVFYDAWEIAGAPGPGHTWSNANPWALPALWPDRRIDYVFSAWPRRGGVGHPVHCEVIGTKPVHGVVPSDHYGVLADLRY